MRIGFISLGDPGNNSTWSGTTHQVYKTLQTKHEVEWLNPNGSNVKTIELGYAAYRKVAKRDVRPYHTIKYAKRLAHNLGESRLSRFDLLFSIGSSEIAYVETGVPIVHLTDATYAQMVEYYDGFDISERFNSNANTVQRLAYEKSSQIIFASKWAADSALADYGVPIDKTNIAEFGPNFDPPQSFDPAPSKAIKMLFVGKDWKRKGGEIAVETFEVLERMGMDVSLTIVGCRPPDGTPTHPKIEIIPFAENIHRYYRDSNVFLLPTRAECAGIVFSEASSFALPCFTTDTGGIGNYVENGFNGYRLELNATGLDFAKTILDEFGDADGFMELRKGARRKFERDLNWEVWMARFDKVASKALSRLSPDSSAR